MFGAFLWMMISCMEHPEKMETDTIIIGALLPFTGDIGATGGNIEKALIMIEEEVNKAGGIGGGKQLKGC